MKKDITIRWLNKAALEFDAAFDYLLTKNPEAAKRFAKQAIFQIDNLAIEPFIGKSGRVSGTRELVIIGFQYIVPYRVCDNQIQILRFFHTKQNPPNFW